MEKHIGGNAHAKPRMAGLVVLLLCGLSLLAGPVLSKVSLPRLDPMLHARAMDRTDLLPQVQERNAHHRFH